MFHRGTDSGAGSHWLIGCDLPYHYIRSDRRFKEGVGSAATFFTTRASALEACCLFADLPPGWRIVRHGDIFHAEKTPGFDDQFVYGFRKPTARDAYLAVIAAAKGERGAADAGEVERLRAENKQLTAELDEARRKLAEAEPSSARKIGGSYEADGHVVARFKTLAGAERLVFEFAEPAGLLHIFRPDQVQSARWAGVRT